MSFLKKVNDALKKFGTDAEKRSFGTTAPDDTVTKMDSGDVVIKGLDDREVEALNTALKEDGYKGPGLRLFTLTENLNMEFDTKKLLQKIKENNKQLINYMRRDTKSMEELVALAQTSGYQKVVKDLLVRKPGKVPPPEDVLVGLITMINLATEMNKMAKLGRDATDIATKQNIHKNFSLLASVQTNLVTSVSGAVSEYARGMAVTRHFAKIENMDLTAQREFLNNFVTTLDEGKMDYDFNVYLSFDNATQKAKYAEKGFLAKGYDMAMEMYINALLSSAPTHMVNIIGNAGFQLQTLAERGIAGVIGEVRTRAGKLFNVDGAMGDRVYIGEMSAEAHGLINAQRDAFKLMAKSMVTGKTGDFGSKIDLRVKRAIGDTDDITEMLNNASNGDYSKMAINTLGVATRLPGRFLASEDAYFKVITRRKVLYREAFRYGQKAYDDALQSGLSKADAKLLAEKEYTRIMEDTPDEVNDLMTSEALKQTFQGELTGFQSTLGKFFQFPGLKLVVPFYNTPANIVNEVFDRTLNFSPIYRALKQNLPNNRQGLDPFGVSPISGREFDLALGKLALGNTIAMTMMSMASGMYGDDVIITGAGPTDPKAYKYKEGKVPQYSIGFKQDDETYRFYSFSRFDPISGMLAMGADVAHYMKYEDDPNAIMSVVKGYVLGVAEYAKNMPFLQGFSELVDAFSNKHGDKEDKAEAILGYMAERGIDLATTVVGTPDRITGGALSYMASQMDVPFMGGSSFIGAMERYNNPKASNTMLTDEQLEGNADISYFMKAVYERMNYHKSRNPYFSDELPPKLNFWGEDLYQGEGRLDELFNPMRIINGEVSELDAELIRLSESGAGVFSPHPKKIGLSGEDRYDLSSTEYNEYVHIVNEVDEYGNLPGDAGYDITSSLAFELQDIVNNDTDYAKLQFDGDKYDMLSSVLSNRRKLARDHLINQNERLKLLLTPNDTVN